MKILESLKKRFSFLIKLLASPMTIGVIVTGFMTWIAIQFYASQHDVHNIDTRSVIGVFDQIHRKTIDFRFLNRGEFRGSSRVAILAIDDASIEREGRWPWPREKIGRLIENAIDGGAKVVAFDVVFSEADQNSSSRTLSNLKQNLAKMSQGKGLSPDVEELLDKEIEAGNSDKKFASTVGLYQDAVVMGTYYDTESHDVGLTLNPLRDYCIDASYGRTFEKKYWDKEEIFPVVNDPYHSAEGVSRPPEVLLSRVANHITGIEITKASQWFEANISASEAILQSLRNLDVSLPAQTVPILFVWANIGDEQSLFELLNSEEELRRFANRPMILQIFASVLKSLTTPQIADLRQAISRDVVSYCQRFLSPSDELLDRAKLYEGADQPKEVLDEVWLEQGLEPAWDQYVLEKKVSPIPLATAITNWRAAALSNPVEMFEKTWISVPEVAATTKHTGYFNAALDPDGTVRRSRLIARRGHVYIPSLALKAFLLDRKLGVRVNLEKDTSNRVDLKRMAVRSVDFINQANQIQFSAPVDSHGLLMINYSGPQQMFEYVSASSLLSTDADLTVSQRMTDPVTGAVGIATRRLDRKEFLKDKILIVGATSIGVYDLRQSPFEENYPGVETHANVLSNLLTEEARSPQPAGATVQAVPAEQPGFLKIHPLEEKAMWIVILVGGLALSAALTYLGSVAGLLATVSVLASFYAVDRYILFANGYVINASLPFIMACAIFVGITSYKYFTEERNKRALKGTFAKYVSPAVVEEILKDPSNIELGGKKMELTVMFSDVRGFTTISEKLDPRALSDLLNSYLTPMTDLVFENKGTLDKYMGDAIMAFWGAPIHFPDHADRAATCALMMLKRLKILQDEYVAKGLPTIDIGIGLNTGDMSVGNMGSNTVRSYTVMGDSVNLGSRLEGINKEYGTRIIVSEFTQSRIAKSFVTREVDWVRVKGKAQPVRIFELIGTKSSGTLSAPDQMLAVLPDFESGFKLYHERKFDEAVNAFTRALNSKPDDECSQLYIERCHDYIKEAPPEDWDGVYTMKTK